jgi:hypothetical protein
VLAVSPAAAPYRTSGLILWTHYGSCLMELSNCEQSEAARALIGVGQTF